MSEIKVLEGKTISSVEINDVPHGDEVIFECTDGSKFRMYHQQDCCESVYLENNSIEELRQIVGEKVIDAYESGSSSKTAWGTESWTFYNINTPNHSVTLRWYGSSNGYYSESVTFEAVEKPAPKIELTPLEKAWLDYVKTGKSFSFEDFKAGWEAKQ